MNIPAKFGNIAKIYVKRTEVNSLFDNPNINYLNEGTYNKPP